MSTIVSVFGVQPFRIGGTETFARELSRQLQQRGWKSVLCFLSEPSEEVRRFLTLPNVTLEVVADSTNLSWQAVKELARIIRRHKPDILHLHFIGFLGLFPWLARLLSVPRVFFTDHSSRTAGYVAHRAPFLKRLIARTVNLPITKVICVSRYGQRCLTTLDLLPHERYELVYNAVDLSRVQNSSPRGAEFRRRYNIPEDRVVIVQVSWMIPEKGIPELLETARILLERNTKVQFVLVGEGPAREAFMRRAQEMKLDHSFIWTGLIQDPFGEGVFDAADIVCQLSAWEELFGWMIAEAMAHGKPVVATSVGGIPELVEDGVSGFLVSAGDHEAAAQRLNRLAQDGALRSRMGQAGRVAVKDRFDLERNVARLIELYIG